eukprot:TRINITY_DN9774_c0_g1_i8.p1 TRINITY_DN9774_c0_g1~~TRINITY_DN9774_c0_g1_i8.p1  ORF type:complete len:1151 (+),score=148.30 TRINITY_DN9774_c0_g1_i8:129-3581(+)
MDPLLRNVHVSKRAKQLLKAGAAVRNRRDKQSGEKHDPPRKRGGRFKKKVPSTPLTKPAWASNMTGNTRAREGLLRTLKAPVPFNTDMEPIDEEEDEDDMLQQGEDNDISNGEPDASEGEHLGSISQLLYAMFPDMKEICICNTNARKCALCGKSIRITKENRGRTFACIGDPALDQILIASNVEISNAQGRRVCKQCILCCAAKTLLERSNDGGAVHPGSSNESSENGQSGTSETADGDGDAVVMKLLRLTAHEFRDVRARAKVKLDTKWTSVRLSPAISSIINSRAGAKHLSNSLRLAIASLLRDRNTPVVNILSLLMHEHPYPAMRVTATIVRRETSARPRLLNPQDANRRIAEQMDHQIIWKDLLDHYVATTALFSALFSRENEFKEPVLFILLAQALQSPRKHNVGPAIMTALIRGFHGPVELLRILSHHGLCSSVSTMYDQEQAMCLALEKDNGLALQRQSLSWLGCDNATRALRVKTVFDNMNRTLATSSIQDGKRKKDTLTGIVGGAMLSTMTELDVAGVQMPSVLGRDMSKRMTVGELMTPTVTAPTRLRNALRAVATFKATAVTSDIQFSQASLDASFDHPFHPSKSEVWRRESAYLLQFEQLSESDKPQLDQFLQLQRQEVLRLMKNAGIINTLRPTHLTRKAADDAFAAYAEYVRKHQDAGGMIGAQHDLHLAQQAGEATEGEIECLDPFFTFGDEFSIRMTRTVGVTNADTLDWLMIVLCYVLIAYGDLHFNFDMAGLTFRMVGAKAFVQMPGTLAHYATMTNMTEFVHDFSPTKFREAMGFLESYAFDVIQCLLAEKLDALTPTGIDLHKFKGEHVHNKDAWKRRVEKALADVLQDCDILDALETQAFSQSEWVEVNRRIAEYQHRVQLGIPAVNLPDARAAHNRDVARRAKLAALKTRMEAHARGVYGADSNIRLYLRYAVGLYTLTVTFKEAIRQGDGTTLLLIKQYLPGIMDKMGLKNYAMVCIHELYGTRNGGTNSEAIRRTFDRFYRTRNGALLALDEFNEHLVRLTKKLPANLFSPGKADQLKRAVKMIPLGEEIKASYMGQTKGTVRTPRDLSKLPLYTKHIVKMIHHDTCVRAGGGPDNPSYIASLANFPRLSTDFSRTPAAQNRLHGKLEKVHRYAAIADSYRSVHT